MSKVFSAVSFLDHGKIFVRNKRAGEVDQKITTAGGGLKMSIPAEEGNPAASFAVTYGAPVFNSILPDRHILRDGLLKRYDQLLTNL